MNKNVLATLTAGALLAVQPGSNAFAAELETDADKLSYSLGMMIGAQITPRYGELDFDILMEALQSQHNGEETTLTIQDAQTTIQAYENIAREEAQKLAAEKGKVAMEEGAAFLAENKKKEGIMVTESGLQYQILSEGEGPKPAETDTVSVHYVGSLLDGTEFDSSIARGQPAEFGLRGVIPGWTEGLQLMNSGSKYRFFIPSDLGYGERGAGGDIGPNETLIFEVELLEIK